MILTALLGLAISLPAQTSEIAKMPETMCPVMKGRPTTSRFAVDYGPFRTYVCCDTCVRTFRDSPGRYMEQAGRQGTKVGIILFHPKTGERLDPKAANRFQELGSFFAPLKSGMPDVDSSLLSWEVIPRQECLTCPITGKELACSGQAAGYLDLEGLRVYFATPEAFSEAGTSKDWQAAAQKSAQPLKARAMPVPGVKFE
ncbi:MAG: hypothetical protein LCH41_05815 [Armatimonadetes bacterium]|nr:hypothetical protein [Armatimonadota bacterium]